MVSLEGIRSKFSPNCSCNTNKTQFSLVHPAFDQIRSDQIRLDQIWTGLDWTGLDWTGLDWMDWMDWTKKRRRWEKEALGYTLRL